MDILDAIGNTPLVRLEKLGAASGAKIFVKLETCNPGGSIKDRAAKAYVAAAMESGLLRPGGCIVEATSGNLGIGLALVAGKLGFPIYLTLPESASQERKTLLKTMGANLILTPAKDGMSGAVARVQALLKEIPGSFRPDQFASPIGPLAHYENTGPEISRAAQAQSFRVDAFVAAVGSGATLCGTAKFLKERDPACQAFAVEPAESAVLSGNLPGAHGIQGIGAGFVPAVYQADLIDEILTVSTDQAMRCARDLLRQEGINCGISSGANVAAALALARRPEFQGRNIVTIACDTGERYLSTAMFREEEQ